MARAHACINFVPALILAAAALAARPALADDNAPSGPTFAKDVAPLLYSRCAECHHPGDVAPMSLMSYDEARPWAKAIKKEVAARRMPPWHADNSGGPYLGDTSLTDKDIATLVGWVDAGAPMGDAKDLPAAPTFSGDWKLGKPDLVLPMPESYTLSPDGGDLYRCFVMDPTPEDVWVNGFEVHPGNRAINHHTVLFLDGDGRQSAMRDAAEPGPGYECYGSPGFQPMDIFGVWAPGMTPERLPEGVARPVPKGSRIVLQLHYHRDGKEETDRSEVGLYFAKGPVKKKANLGIALDFRLMIPPGKSDFTSIASWTLPRDGDIVAAFPHMHVLGKNIGMTATLPDGTTRSLVNVPRYDFDWQRNYLFKDPVHLPGGTRIDVTAIYDNTEANPRNPNKPPKPVHFGMGTMDEMNIGFVTFTYSDEDRIASGAGFPTEPTIVMDSRTLNGTRDKVHEGAGHQLGGI